MLVPVLFLALVAFASRPAPKQVKKLTPAERQKIEERQQQREHEMLLKQWEMHKIEMKVMQEQLKTAKHVLIQNGHRVPSETDESDSWFRPGKNDGAEGLKQEHKTRE
jgi:hypothetical protein